MIYEQVTQGDVMLILLKRSHLVALQLDGYAASNITRLALALGTNAPRYSQKSQPNIGSLCWILQPCPSTVAEEV